MNSLNDSPKITGYVKATLFNEDGVVLYQEQHNLVVAVGLEFIAARMVDAGSPTEMTHMALGSSNTTAVPLDTTLGAELGRVGVNGGAGVVDANTVTYNAVFPAGIATGEVVEAGVFNDVTAGTMMCRTVFPVINKTENDSLAISWVITVN